MSVRGRLVAIVVTLLIAGLLAAGGGIHFALRGFLIDRIDSQLTTSAVFAVPEIAARARSTTEPAPSDTEPLPADGEIVPSFAEVRGPDGRPIPRAGFHMPNVDPKLPRTLPMDEATQTDAGKLLTVNGYRVLAAPLPEGRTALLGASLGKVRETLRQLLLIELVVGSGTLLLITLLAWRAVGRGLRPLAEIAADAGAIGAGDPARRVRHEGPNTEVGRLARSLNAAFDARRAAEERLRRFVADASHELRTPLTSIRGYAELFRRGAATRPDDLAASMSRIEQEAGRMGVMVDELLLLARLDQGRPLEREAVDLAALAADAVADARAAEPDRPITLRAPETAVVTGDPARLYQVLVNLLANVAEHTPRRGAAEVRVTAVSGGAEGTLHGAEHLRLEVIDTGPGLDAQQRARVFERFYRGDASRHGGRSGLGLAIVAAVVEAHGGSVEALEPEHGAGTRLQILLPTGATQPTGATLPTGAAQPTGATQPFDGRLPADSQPVCSRSTARRGELEPTTPEAFGNGALMTRLSRFVLGHKAMVTLFWLVILVAGLFAASVVPDKLSTRFSFPGQSGYETNVEILQRYNGTGAAGHPLVPVVSLPERATAPNMRADLGRAFQRLDQRPQLRAVSYPATGDEGFLADGGRTVFGLVFVPFTGEAQGPQWADSVRSALQSALPDGSRVQVTGLSELASESASSEGGTGVLVETLLAATGALIVLAVVFGSLLAFVPLLVAGVAILATFLAVLGLTAFTDVSFIVQFLVALIGLGVAIDYSLLLVTRWREERSAGHGRQESVHRAMATAGRSVIFSGITVAIGLLVLVLVPVPFLQSVGYAGGLIPLLSVLVTLSLLPVVLATAGPRLDRHRLRSEAGAGRIWTRWANSVVRHPRLATVAALALLTPLVVAAVGIRLGDAPSEALPGSGPARTALQNLQDDGVPSGVLTPIEVLVPEGGNPGAVAGGLGRVEGTYAAVATQPGRDGSTVVEVLPRQETSVEAGQQTVARVREAVEERFPGARVGGSGAQLIDAVDALYGNLVLLLSAVAAATFVLLARAFRSLVLAGQAVVLNLVSIAAAYGAAVLIWQHGFGSELLFGFPALGSITFWVPLATFAFLYGLSMDYEVFLLSRMRETYDETGSTSTAVVEGLGRVGRLVTSAALILFLAFISLSAVPEVDVKVMATTLGIGILLDATILRALLVPALVAMTGRWTWWLPRWAARPLRVPASPPAPRSVAARPEHAESAVAR